MPIRQSDEDLQLALKEQDADRAESWQDDSDYLCHGCNNYVEAKAEFCNCGVCPDCCTGAICETSNSESGCGHCDGEFEE